MAAALLAFVAMSPAGHAAAQERITLAGRKVAVWRPGQASGRQPVIVFSHGFGGCAVQSRFLTEGLAAAGYWVFAPDHRDASCRMLPRKQPQERFIEPAAWSDRTYRDRADDIRALLDALRASPEFRTRLDFDRIGLAGHSLGGYTALGLGGAWASWKLPGVRAVLALSAYTNPFLQHATLGGLDVPVMYQGGTRDPGVTPFVDRTGGAFDRSPAPKYLVVFQGASHSGWTNLEGAAHPVMLQYATAFFDHYLRGMPASPILTAPAPGVSELRWDSDLGHAGVGSNVAEPTPLHRPRTIPRP